ncbi:hypothetical protein [Hymenobacter algoricola]|uniref:DUF3575 domain-containing protein n=1 Tax=Hymenobacter algoricola TaxID=486267 RepID=A0ABP7NFA4_9BACT
MTLRPAPLFLSLAFFVATALLAPDAWAQKYRTAVGLRLGRDNYGLTLQQKIFAKTTLEGLALVAPREASGTVLIERHFGILGPSLNYYFGAGGHVGNHKDNGVFGGVDALAGVEYKTAFFPFVLSFDVKPTLEINGTDWARFPAAFSVRYVLIKEKKTGLLNGIFGGSKDQENPRKERKADDAPRRGRFDF